MGTAQSGPSTGQRIGGKRNQRETMRTLGLKRVGDVVVEEAGPRSGEW